MTKLIGCLMILTATVLPVAAEQIWSDTSTASHHAHIHGEAQLEIVSDEKTLWLTLFSPAMNLLGFEQKAVSPAQQQTVTAVTQLLQHEAGLYTFQGTECQRVAVTVTMPETKLGSAQDDHAAHGHGDHSAHEHGEHQQSADHTDIVAKYQYQCAKLSQLTAIKTELLQQFQALTKVTVQWVVQGRQGALVLRNKARDIGLQ